MADLTRHELHNAMNKEFGEGHIIVYKPKDLEYFITASSNKPFRTKEILKGLIERM